MTSWWRHTTTNAAAFAELLTANVLAIRHPGEVLQRSRDEEKEHYARSLAQYPEGSTRITYRVVLSDRVVDHEVVSRRPDAPPIDVVTNYEVRSGQIRRIGFVSLAPVGA